jgi:TFIIF-interacting CTD phosphatase-like protein
MISKIKEKINVHLSKAIDDMTVDELFRLIVLLEKIINLAYKRIEMLEIMPMKKEK